MIDDLNNDIAKTALIPLWARAYSADLIFENKEEWLFAKNIIDKNDFDITSLKSLSKIAKITTALDIGLRSIYINNILESQNKDIQIINFGAGFDLKSHLFGKKITNWINIDVREIIDMRKAIFEKDTAIEGSILDFDFKRLPKMDSIMILEGVAMYFDKNIVRKFVSDYYNHLPNSKLIIEIGGKWISKFQHPAFKAMNLDCKYFWGANGRKEFQKLFPELSIIEHQKILEYKPNIWNKYSPIIKNLPLIASKFGSQIVVAERSNPGKNI